MTVLSSSSWNTFLDLDCLVKSCELLPHTPLWERLSLSISSLDLDCLVKSCELLPHTPLDLDLDLYKRLLLFLYALKFFFWPVGIPTSQFLAPPLGGGCFDNARDMYHESSLRHHGTP
jgi:hypothetical protein